MIKTQKSFYNGHIISFPFDQRSNLPCKSMIAGCHYYCQFVGQITGKDAKIPTPSNFKCCYGKHADHDNLSKAERTLLRLHHCYSHRSMLEIRQWAKEGKYNIPAEVADIPDHLFLYT